MHACHSIAAQLGKPILCCICSTHDTNCANINCVKDDANLWAFFRNHRIKSTHNNNYRSIFFRCSCGRHFSISFRCCSFALSITFIRMIIITYYYCIRMFCSLNATKISRHDYKHVVHRTLNELRSCFRQRHPKQKFKRDLFGLHLAVLLMNQC